MTRFLHVADLHLSAGEDRAYSFQVLDEIVTVANSQAVDCLLLCGDVFNSAKDVELLREEFRARIDNIKARVLFLPGNHEVLGSSFEQFTRFVFGKAEVLSILPFSFFVLAGDPEVEILALPHPCDFSDLRKWPVPPKGTASRLALCHGQVLGMGFSGFEPEAGGRAIDPDLFVRFGVDYAALGHLHSRPSPKKVGSTSLVYAGSARVWSEGESGPRGGFIIDCQSKLSYEFVPLPSAGEFRAQSLPLNVDGTLGPLLETEKWQPNDYIKLSLCGLCEDERFAEQLRLRLQEELAPKVRKLKIDMDDVMVLSGAAATPVTRSFLRLWAERCPPPSSPEYDLYLRARMLGLTKLKAHLEKRT